MAQSDPFLDAVNAAIQSAPGQRITHASLVQQLRQQGFSGIGMALMQLAASKVVTAETVIENNSGVLYYSPAAG